MIKALIYSNGQIYITGTGTDITPSGVEPVEQYDLDSLTDDEVEQVRSGNKDLLSKATKL